MIILETAMDGISRQSLARFATRAQKLAGVSGEVAVLITGSRQIQQLNKRFRGKNKPTDVLSFPREDGGDIAISADIAQSNARRLGHSIAGELKVLILHGMLHLAGYDHENDNGRMEKREARLRAQLKLPASLIERTMNGTDSSPVATKSALGRHSGKQRSRRKIAAHKPRTATDKTSAVADKGGA